MSQLKKFIGVYFGKEWQIVPKEWITDAGKELQCYWPPDGNVEWLARSGTPPNPSTDRKSVV